MMNKVKIGFIGQGWIGSNYSSNFEERGYEVVRYSLEPKYIGNKDKIGDCDMVFIAVPTPTTPKGFDVSILESAIGATMPGQIVVIKSTIIPGTTEALQFLFPDRKILFSPEFLREATAKHDVDFPDRNIVGYTWNSRNVADKVMSVLPSAPYNKVMHCRNAEMVKYMGNVFLYFKVIVGNLFYDIAEKIDIDYDIVKDAVIADSRIGKTHFDVVHNGGRGAGGDCFIKDFEAFRQVYQKTSGVMKANDQRFPGGEVIRAISKYNKTLLDNSEKDQKLVKNVFGEETNANIPIQLSGDIGQGVNNGPIVKNTEGDSGVSGIGAI